MSSEGAAEAIREIIKLTKNTTEIVEPPGLRGRKFALRPPGSDDLEMIDALPLGRCHAALSLDGFTRALKHYATHEPKPEITVFIGDTQIVAVLDEHGERLDRLSLCMEHTAGFAVLMKADQEFRGFASKQDDFVWSLRTQLPRFTPETLLADVEKRVAGVASDFPEDVSFIVDVWKNVDVEGAVARVACFLGIDVDKGTFQIKPRDQEIAVSQRKARDAVAEAIEYALGAELMERIHLIPHACAHYAC